MDETQLKYKRSLDCCLNGEEHKWEPIIGAPEEYFKDMYRCKFCQEEKKLRNRRDKNE